MAECKQRGGKTNVECLKSCPEWRMDGSVYFYLLVSLELIAEEIEGPFGGDDNDLPTKKLAANIKKHLEELLSQPT